jgi:hypothetical protein
MTNASSSRKAIEKIALQSGTRPSSFDTVLLSKLRGHAAALI